MAAGTIRPSQISAAPERTVPRPETGDSRGLLEGGAAVGRTVMSRTSAPLRQPDDGCPYDRHRRLGSLETPAYAAGVDAVMCSAAQLHGVHGSRLACVLSGRLRLRRRRQSPEQPATAEGDDDARYGVQHEPPALPPFGPALPLFGPAFPLTGSPPAVRGWLAVRRHASTIHRTGPPRAFYGLCSRQRPVRALFTTCARMHSGMQHARRGSSSSARPRAPRARANARWTMCWNMKRSSWAGRRVRDGSPVGGNRRPTWSPGRPATSTIGSARSTPPVERR